MHNKVKKFVEPFVLPICTLGFLALLFKIYRRGSKKGCQCSVAVQLRGQEIAFSKCIFLFQLKVMQKVTKKVAHGKKKSQKCKKSCQIALFCPKSTTESLNSYIVFCFALHSR